MTKIELKKIWQKRLAKYENQLKDDLSDQDVDYIEVSIDVTKFILYVIEKL